MDVASISTSYCTHEAVAIGPGDRISDGIVANSAQVEDQGIAVPSTESDSPSDTTTISPS